MSEESASVPPGPAVIKVAIIEDVRDIREGLAMMIKFTEGYRCTGSFRSMEEALEKFELDLPRRSTG